MVDLPFDLPHPLDIARGGTDGGHCAIWYTPAAVPRLAHGLLDRQPRIDPLSLAPNRAHLGTGVTLNHLGPL